MHLKNATGHQIIPVDHYIFLSSGLRYAVDLSKDNEQPAVALTWSGSVCFMKASHIFSLMNESFLFIGEYSKGKNK